VALREPGEIDNFLLTEVAKNEARSRGPLAAAAAEARTDPTTHVQELMTELDTLVARLRESVKQYIIPEKEEIAMNTLKQMICNQNKGVIDLVMVRYANYLGKELGFLYYEQDDNEEEDIKYGICLMKNIVLYEIEEIKSKNS